VNKRPLALLAVLPLLGCNPQEETASAPDRPTTKIETEEQQVYYALGASFGQNFGELSPEQVAAIQQGLEDQAQGRELAVDLAEMQPRVGQMMQARAVARVTKARADGERFVAEAAQKDGARQLESGIVVEVLEEGDGPRPKLEDVVKVHYRGSLADGTEFDSSYAKGQPLVLSLGQFIPCWQQGLQELKVGSKARIVCPANTAYGDQGQGSIPGGAALVFEMELLGIETE
jgi:FKBP-type peptidyl-prolyl cis-trans isomerase FkpA